MKIIIVGNGMLGKAFPEEIERIPKKAKDWYFIDEYIQDIKPDVVINCAGVTGYRCGEEPYNSFVANVSLPFWLAQSCMNIKAKLIQFSTFYKGESLYLKQKNFLEIAVDWLYNMRMIYLPTLFDKDNLPYPYDECFHVAYTKDVADYVIKNIKDDRHIYLCNEGYPTRKEFLEYINEKGLNFSQTRPIKRSVPAREEFGSITNMRYWKSAVDEVFQ